MAAMAMIIEFETGSESCQSFFMANKKSGWHKPTAWGISRCTLATGNVVLCGTLLDEQDLCL